MTRVRARVHEGALIKLTSDVSARLAYNAARKTQARLRRLAPKDTHALSESFIITRLTFGPTTSYSVHSPLDYARYQNKGTGPIVAKAGGVLRFQSRGQIVFAKSTKGVPATHFIDRARAEITITDFL